MKSFFKTNLWYIAATIIVALVLASCGQKNNDPLKPTPPKDQTENKLHEDPYKAEFILQECHTHGPTTWHGNGNMEETKFFTTSQKITYVLDKEHGWGPAEDSPKSFKVKCGRDFHKDIPDQPSSTFYTLVIKYYNKAGEEITNQFLTNGQEKIHQHFFIPQAKSVREWTAEGTGEALKIPKDKDGALDIMQYIYLDTDPWNGSWANKEPEDIKLIGEKDPRGFKGVLRFNNFEDVKELAGKFYELDVEIALMHSRTSKFDPKKTLSKTETPSPAKAPSKEQRGTDFWDLNTNVHFIVYCSPDETLETSVYNEEDEEIAPKFDQLEDDAEKDFIKRMAKAWEITLDQATYDAFYCLWGTSAGHVDPNI